MLSISEKIAVLDNTIANLQTNKGYILDYIDKINNGMEDPDSTLEKNLKRLEGLNQKINALNNERALLKSQQ